jgi:hypothetical protein
MIKKTKAFGAWWHSKTSKTKESPMQAAFNTASEKEHKIICARGITGASKIYASYSNTARLVKYMQENINLYELIPRETSG